MKRQPDSVKIGAISLASLKQFCRLYAGTEAEIARRALDLYIEIRRATIFYRVAEMLNGRKLSVVIIELLTMWVEGKVKLSGD